MAFNYTAFEVTSERVFVVEDSSGRVLHVHRVLTHGDVKGMTDDEAKKRALEFAGKIGHDTKSLGVRRFDDYKPST